MSDHNGTPRRLYRNGDQWAMSDAFQERIYRTIALRRINYRGPLDDEGYPPVGFGSDTLPSDSAYDLDDVVNVALLDGGFCGGWDGVTGYGNGARTEFDLLAERKGWQQ